MQPFGQEQDDEVIRLLGKLRDTGPEYPPSMLARRRVAVLAALALLPLGGALALSWFARLVKLVQSMSFVDKIILGVEMVAVSGLTVYGGVTAYIYRNELKQLLLPNSGPAGTPFPSLSVNTMTSVAVTDTVTPTPTGTLTPLPLTIEPTQEAAPGPSVAPTSAPVEATPDKGGLHLGQTKTPKPEGTP